MKPSQFGKARAFLRALEGKGVPAPAAIKETRLAMHANRVAERNGWQQVDALALHRVDRVAADLISQAQGI